MAGLTVIPHASVSSGAPALSTDLLAIVVAVVAFIVSGVFLLTLVPEREALAEAAARPDEVEPGGVTAQTSGDGQNTGFGQGTFSPLGGAGAPPRRLAQRLPVERDGATRFVEVDDIVAVHANAHYTYIFSGTAKLFCPLPIGDVEQRLDSTRFVRVHRSHIVSLDRVIGLRRAGDGALVELAAPEPYTVPVARNRVTRLKARIGSRPDRIAS
jgi:DNA-binding LytR/AlgR family response regulator